MRRLLADRLAFATGLIVILMSALFALWRTGGVATWHGANPSAQVEQVGR